MKPRDTKSQLYTYKIKNSDRSGPVLIIALMRKFRFYNCYFGNLFHLPSNLERSPSSKADKSHRKREENSLTSPRKGSTCYLLNESAHRDQASLSRPAKPFRGASLANPYCSQNKVYICIIIISRNLPFSEITANLVKLQER